MTAKQTLPLGVVVERRTLDSPWQDAAWRPLAVLPGAPEGEPWRLLRSGEGWEHYLAGILELELHPSDAHSYRQNLLSTEPRVFVGLRADGDVPSRPVRLLMVTVAPDEAQSLTDAGDDTVEGVAMPEMVRAWLGDFVDRHYVEKPFFKRERKGLDKGPAKEPARGLDDPRRRDRP